MVENTTPQPENSAVTVLSLKGVNLGNTKQDLFQLVKSMERLFIVDNHVPWARLSALPKHRNTAFILGTTISKETRSVRDFFTNTDGLKIRHNVFFFGLRFPPEMDIAIIGPGPHLWIQRLDEHCFGVYDHAAMNQWIDSGSPWDDSASINEGKQTILSLLSVATIEKLHSMEYALRTSKANALHAAVEERIQLWFKDFEESRRVAEYAYAILLLDNAAARRDFAALGNKNVFGDMQLIQNALFWQADILSQDHAVRMMAKCCFTNCRTSP